jgi:hypothetical protein
MFTLTKKARRILALIEAVEAAGNIQPGAALSLPGEKPATYLGPGEVEGGIQMHVFRLHDGLEVPMQVPALDLPTGRPASPGTTPLVAPAVR